MWEVIRNIVYAVLDRIGINTKKLQPSSNKRINIPSPNNDGVSNSQRANGSKSANSKDAVGEFDLSILKSLFDAFSIQLYSYDALYHLLNAIEKKSYLETLRTINERAKTPKDLIELTVSSLPEDPFDQIIFERGIGGPYIKREYIVKLCKDKELPTIGSEEVLIKNLIVANIKSGINHFNIVFGFQIQTMKEKFDVGENVTIDFAKIKAKFSEIV